MKNPFSRTRTKSLLPGAPDKSSRTTTPVPAYAALYKAAGGSVAYAEIVKNSPALTAVVRTIATNGAELPIEAFMRPEGKPLDFKNPLVKLLDRPNPRTSGFAFRRDIYADLTVYENAIYVKVRDDAGKVGALVRVPPWRVSLKTEDSTDVWKYEVRFDRGAPKEYDPSEVLHFHGYNPLDSRIGVSKIEALKGVLSEERASTESRAGFWLNAARREGLVERPSTAPDWNDEERDAWRNDFEAVMTGAANAGRVGLLEDDMKFKDTSFNAQESQFVEGRLTMMQVVFATFGVPLQFAGAGDRNTVQARRSLYQDAILPVASLIDSTLTHDLVPDVLGDQATGGRIYVRTGASGIVRGDIQMQFETFGGAVKDGLLTPDEARAEIGRPPVPGGDRLREPAGSLPGGGVLGA